MQTVLRLGVGLLLIFGAGCSQFGDPQPVRTPKQSVKGPTEKQQEVSKQGQTKALVKPIAKKEVVVSAEEQRELKELTNQSIIYRGSAKSKRIALTFDDGPDDQLTLKILAILRKEQVRATFFVTGKMVRKYPQFLKQIEQEGHVIGNHTWSHSELTKLTTKQIHKEVNDTSREIQRRIGKRVSLIRPPYGATNKKVIHTLKRDRYEVINWDVDTNDWRGRSGKQIEQTVIKDSKPGSIVLQHNAGNNLQGTVDALPTIIKHFKKLDYEFVTVDQLLALSPYQGTVPDVTFAPKEESTPEAEEEKSKKANSKLTKPEKQTQIKTSH